MIDAIWILGPVHLSVFGVFVGLGVLLGLGVSLEGLRARQIPAWQLCWALPAVAASSGLGAAYAHALDHGGLEVLEYWLYAPRAYPGYSFLGGFVGFLVGLGLCTALFRWLGQRASTLDYLDACAPGILLAYGIGRLGCHLVGHTTCCGIPSDSWLAVTYPYTLGDGVQVLPTALMEGLAGILSCAFLRRACRAPVVRGRDFALMLILLGLERLLIEEWRVNPRHALDLSQAQWLSAAMALVGTAWFIRVVRKPPSVSAS